MKKTTRNALLLVLAAFIWGIAFVAQSEGGDAVGSFSFNSIRSLLGAAVLLPVIALLDKLGLSRPPKTREDKKNLWTGGVLCGIILTVASNLQQVGINLGTAAGKAGFLTACYILVVPVLGLFFGKRCSLRVWFGVFLTVIGLYLLCIKESMSLEPGDILLLLCAVVYSTHIFAIDHFSPIVDGVRMSAIQFLTAGLLTFLPMVIFEVGFTPESFSAWLPGLMSLRAWIPILYAGICSCGIAYTCQIVGQQGVNPSVAALLMSLESVFSVLAGFVLLQERLTLRELLGCGLIFVAVILAQLPGKEEKTA